MILLQSKKESTRFQILVEIASRQPNVRQKEIAREIGITPQAVSEYVKEMVKEGLLFTEGRVRYRVTKEGVEWLLERARELKKYAGLVTEEIVKSAAIWPAIAEETLEKDEKVYLHMQDGLLYATTSGDGSATGTTVQPAEAGEDVGVTDLQGMIELEHGLVTIARVPRIDRGGSRRVDLEKLKKLVESKPYLAVLGVEALIALKKIRAKPNVMFGARESVIEAAFHGLSSLVVAVDAEIPALLKRLEEEGLTYKMVDTGR